MGLYYRNIGDIRDSLQRFQPIDSNNDFVLDQGEIEGAGKGLDIWKADTNSDKVVTVEEYLKFKQDGFSAAVASKIFAEDWLHQFSPLFEKCSVTDPYERLILALSLVTDINDSVADIEKRLKKTAELVPEMSLIGMIEPEIVNFAHNASRYLTRGTITMALKGLEELTFNSEQEKKEFLRSIIIDSPNHLDLLAKHLQKAIRAYLSIGLTGDEIKEIIKRGSFVLSFAEDVVSMNIRLKLFKDSELAEFARSALKEKGGRLNRFYVFSSGLAVTVRYLRKKNVSEDDIKDIIRSAAKYINRSDIIKSIPEVIEGFKTVGMDPVAELKKYLEKSDENKFEMGLPFLTFAKNIKWLKTVAQDGAEFIAAIDKGFSNDINFDSVPKMYEVSEGVVPDDSRLSWALEAAAKENSFSFYWLEDLFKQLKEMDLKAETKKIFADFALRINFSGLLECGSYISEMGSYNIEDDFIIDTLNFFIATYLEDGPDYLNKLLDFASKFQIYQNSSEMRTFLVHMYSNGCYLSNAIEASRAVSDNDVAILKSDPLWPEILRTFRYDDMVELFGYAHNSGFFDGKITLVEVVADCKWMDGNKISHWSRYNKDIVEKMKDPVLNAPMAFISLPGHDHNGAFEAKGVDKVIGKYDLRLAEPYKETELYDTLAKENDDSIDCLVFGGHGSAKSFSLSEGIPDEGSKIDISDDEIKMYLKKVKDRGRIILLSCSTGQKLADKIRQWCDEIGKKVEVIAPPIDVSSELYIDGEGKINVRYYNSEDKEVEGARFQSMSGINNHP